ncbi:uncharacterized protein LOC119315482 [Triticum dicoccoides]|uniref:uncharacterized protein LOC119315482 n=1 Tax=Triticum dicoccoides TaxID=85692 RepID=UPI001891C7D7|nr:uncharacterized protein LOC119315482 [Triticum dicoccoides]
MTTGRGHRVSPAVAAAPLEDDNVLSEVLVRLSPELSSLPLASLVCKPWGRLAASASFRRRWRDHHGRPPVLGVFDKHLTSLKFIPAVRSIPAERFSIQVCTGWDTWRVLGCRQGRVLIMNWTLREFLICDPISGDRHRVSFPPDLVDGGQSANGALLSDGEQLVLVDEARARVEARVYSFATGTWGDIISTAEPCHLTSDPVTVVGSRLYCWLTKPPYSFLELNLESQSLALITSPPRANISTCNSQIIPGEDGTVGLTILLYPTIEMWNRNIDSHGVATWVLRKTVVMDNFVDLTSSWAAWDSLLIGYAEDANAILISVFKGTCIRVFTVQLETMQCNRLHGHLLQNFYYPFASFYNAGPSARRILAHVNNDGGAGGAEA